MDSGFITFLKNTYAKGVLFTKACAVYRKLIARNFQQIILNSDPIGLLSYFIPCLPFFSTRNSIILLQHR